MRHTNITKRCLFDRNCEQDAADPATTHAYLLSTCYALGGPTKKEWVHSRQLYLWSVIFLIDYLPATGEFTRTSWSWWLEHTLQDGLQQRTKCPPDHTTMRILLCWFGYTQTRWSWATQWRRIHTDGASCVPCNGRELFCARGKQYLKALINAWSEFIDGVLTSHVHLYEGYTWECQAK